MFVAEGGFLARICVSALDQQKFFAIRRRRITELVVFPAIDATALFARRAAFRDVNRTIVPRALWGTRRKACRWVHRESRPAPAPVPSWTAEKRCGKLREFLWATDFGLNRGPVSSPC